MDVNRGIVAASFQATQVRLDLMELAARAAAPLMSATRKHMRTASWKTGYMKVQKLGCGRKAEIS
jgi:hypothetical protein